MNGILAQGAGALLGGMLGGNSRKNDAKYAMGMSRHNMSMNQQMANYMQKLQMKTWNETNYDAQVKQMQKAGLNPALMYGQGGGSGGSTQSAGGSVQGGQNPNQPHMMGIGMQTAVQALKAKSDIELSKAQTRKLDADAENVEIDNVTKDRIGQDADIMEGQNRYSKAVQDARALYGQLKDDDANSLDTRHMQNVGNEAVIKEVEAQLAKETKKDVKDTIAQNLINLRIDEEVKQQGINLSKEQERRLYHQIITDYINAGMKGLDTIVKGRFKSIGNGKSKLKSSQTDYNNGNTTYKKYE